MHSRAFHKSKPQRSVTELRDAAKLLGPETEITLYRGPHDMPMIETLTPLLRQADVVFMECLCTPAVRREYEKMLRRLSFNDDAVDRVDPAIFARSKELMDHLGWAMRKSKVPIFLVDESVVPSHAHQKFMNANTIITPSVLDAFEDGKNFPAFYAAANERYDNYLRYVRRRDRLVARQLLLVLMRTRHNSRPWRKVAVIQGYMHFSKPFIERYAPHVTIREYFFDRERTKKFEMVYANAVWARKRKYPKEDLPADMLDKLMLYTIELGNSLQQTPAKEMSGLPDLTSDTIKQPLFQHMLAISEKYHAMSAEEAHRQVLDMFAEGL